jgi:WXG100 family type VII secretion target
MANDRVEIDYEVMDNISKMFQDNHETLKAMMGNVSGLMDRLRSEGWIGRGSDAFFNEMTDEVLPALQRLCESLELADETSRKISQIMSEAEERAGSLFR